MSLLLSDRGSVSSFSEKVRSLNLKRNNLLSLQVNLGKLCNQACKHCHVEAGPRRTEIMEGETLNRILMLLERTPSIQTLDLTGGAPELNPGFRHFVQSASKMRKEIIDRCNLTVFFEPGQEDLPAFLSEYQVHIIASLPCYSDANVDWQRGHGVFEKSIRALQILNQLGYAKRDSSLKLDLVYNPLGPQLPPSQTVLEEEYKKKLAADFGIAFNRLFCITNMPIKRFRQDLIRTHRLEEYHRLLEDHFNAEAAQSVMCRSLLSISWDGKFYDCDFNQMLEMPVPGNVQTIWDVENLESFQTGDIRFGEHCFGCTAGCGSSCGGTTV